jgi:hypothetical protein
MGVGGREKPTVPQNVGVEGVVHPEHVGADQKHDRVGNNAPHARIIRPRDYGCREKIVHSRFDYC